MKRRRSEQYTDQVVKRPSSRPQQLLNDLLPIVLSRSFDPSHLLARRGYWCVPHLAAMDLMWLTAAEIARMRVNVTVDTAFYSC